MVQLTHDDELGPMRGMYGAVDADLEVQRTIKRAELTAFLSLLRRIVGPTTAHIDNKGISVGLWKGERSALARRRRTLICGFSCGRTFPEVEHVKAHRSKKEKNKMKLFERFAISCSKSFVIVSSRERVGGDSCFLCSLWCAPFLNPPANDGSRWVSDAKTIRDSCRARCATTSFKQEQASLMVGRSGVAASAPNPTCGKCQVSGMQDRLSSGGVAWKAFAGSVHKEWARMVSSSSGDEEDHVFAKKAQWAKKHSVARVARSGQDDGE